MDSRGTDQPQDRQDFRRRLGKARDDRRRREDRHLWRKAKSWFGYGLHADAKYEIPAAFSVTQTSRAETKELNGDKLETPLLRCKDFSAGGLDGGPAKLWDRYGPLHAPRGKKRTLRPGQTRPLFDDNVYQRGEVLVLKPALSGAGFEADRGNCGTLKYRCPAAAFGCAGRKECCRARRAGEPSASTSMTVGFSRRPLGAAPPGSGDRRSAPDPQPGRQRLRRSTTGGACGSAS